MCCPAGSTATTTPSDSLSATRHFPGPPVIDEPRSGPPQGPGRGGPLQFPRHPSGRSTSPTPEGSSTPAPGSQTSSMAFAKSTQARHPLISRLRGSLDDAADFASCCGPVSCSTPLRPRPLDRNRGLHYRGPWHLPGPDFHRLAIASLTSGYVTTTSFQSWRPDYWTHVDPGSSVRTVGEKTEVT